MKNSTLVILFFFCAVNYSFAQDSLLINNLKENSSLLYLKKGNLSGEGFNFLKNKAQQSSFILIGENHGLAEIPKFTAALFRSLKDYQYFATETGPYTAKFLQEMAARGKLNQELSSFFKNYKWSIPFYSWVEEAEILESAIDKTSANTDRIWGLDQEFAGSFRMNFKYLMDNAASPESQKIATEYYNLTMSLSTEFFKTGNPGKSFMAVARPDDFKKLKSVFKGQADHLNRIKEMEESIHIYQLWSAQEGHESNRLRAELMKRHFWEYYSKAKAEEIDPKVIFKFGSNHMYRGANALNVFDIGNFVSELASQQKTKSFHLYVLGKKGTQNIYTPFSKNEADKKKSYDAIQDISSIDFSTILKASSNEEWSIIDLQPLRKEIFNRKIKITDKALEKLIWSYDAILVIPEVTASTFFNEDTKRD